MSSPNPPGRPGRNATMFQRLNWILWRAWEHLPDDGEAHMAHRLIREMQDHERQQIAHRDRQRTIWRYNKIPRWVRWILERGS